MNLWWWTAAAVAAGGAAFAAWHWPYPVPRLLPPAGATIGAPATPQPSAAPPAPAPTPAAPAATMGADPAPMKVETRAPAPTAQPFASSAPKPDDTAVRETLSTAIREAFENNPALRQRIIEAAQAQAAAEGAPESMTKEEAETAKQAIAPILKQMLQSPAFTDQIRRMAPPPTQEEKAKP